MDDISNNGVFCSPQVRVFTYDIGAAVLTAEGRALTRRRFVITTVASSFVCCTRLVNSGTFLLVTTVVPVAT